ncbi:MAG: cytochrome c oxidase assembly protein [Actinomycetota bacterium]|nr:cytochrome c oxidase assembly protein [Actinomycetota bacterium]
MLILQRYFLSHWSLDPLFLILTGIPVYLYVVGYRRLERTIARGSRRPPKARRLRATLFGGGIFILVIAVMSPIDYWSDTYLWVHMFQHVLLMAYAPPLLVLSAPWLVMYRGLPVGWRRKLGRTFLVSDNTSWLRKVGNFFMRPLVGFLLFNIAMWGWHFPAMLDLSVTNQWVHNIAHFTFVATGMLLWVHLVDSPPIKPRVFPEIKRVVPIFFTTISSWMLAMIMGFATTPFYSVYLHIPGKTLSGMGDQELAAAVLWVLCMEPFTYAAIYNIKHFMDREENFDYHLTLLTEQAKGIRRRKRVPGLY